jgi:glutathione S-transferase
VVYGRLESWQAVALLGVLRAKGLESRRIEPSSSLVLELAARTGREEGPYLRTPEGFVLADLHAVLDWLERVHPEPGLLPTSDRPVRRICARILEAWIEDWLARGSAGRRPGGSGAEVELEGLAAHLSSSRFLLGPEPSRPDWLLAAWLETEVLVDSETRAEIERRAPRLASLARELFAVDGGIRPEADARDDAIALSLLPLLEQIATDYHPYLQANQSALEQGESELRRVEIGRELAGFPAAAQAAVRRVLDPVGARRVYTLPSALEAIDPADPRSL